MSLDNASMTIYGDSISGNCLKVKFIADRLALPYDWVEVRVLDKETRTPEFLAMNPAGQVPTVILDDGRPLAQSNAIILHLAEGSALSPADAYARAKMLEWMFWEQYSHEPYVATVRSLIRHHAPDSPRLAEIPERRAKGNQALAVMEKHLERRSFFVNERYSVADIALYAYTQVAPDGGIDLTPYPNVLAWIGRVAAQPRHILITDTPMG